MLLLSFKVTASCNWQFSSIPQKWTNQATNVFLHDTACSPLQAAVSRSRWRMLSWDHRDSEAEAGHWSVHHHQRAEHHVQEACYGDIGHSLQKRFLSLWQFVKPSNWEYLTSPVFTYKQIFGNKIFPTRQFPIYPRRGRGLSVPRVIVMIMRSGWHQPPHSVFADVSCDPAWDLKRSQQRLECRVSWWGGRLFWVRGGHTPSQCQAVDNEWSLVVFIHW